MSKFGKLNNPNVQAALVITVLLLVFFNTPFRELADHTYFPADLAQYFPLTRLPQSTYSPSNYELGDVWLDFGPWLIFDQQSIRAGQLPLWNPYNAGGVPHLGNYQSAVFSIFTVPFYLMPFKYAVLLAAFAKLFVIGFFTYLFLKLLGLRQVAALGGAIAFAFCGYNIIWLSFQDIIATVTTLPCCIYFAERLFQSYEQYVSDDRSWRNRRVLRLLVGLGLSEVMGLLAGHPEGVYLTVLLVGLYAVFRIIFIFWHPSNRRKIVRYLLGLIAAFAIVGVLALGITAIQLVPFAEYISNSALSEVRSAMWQALPPQDGWPLVFYPNLMGYPSNPHTVDLMFGNPIFGNYVVYVGTIYLGSALLFLAIVGLLMLFRKYPHRALFIFFGTIAALWIVYIFNIFGVALAFYALPGMNRVWPAQTVPLGLFSLSVCGAIALDWLMAGQDSRIGRVANAILIVLIGAGILTVSLNGANNLLNTASVSQYAALAQTNATLANAQRLSEHLGTVQQHIVEIVLSLTAVIAAAALMLLSSNRTAKRLFGLGIGLLVFFQSGFLLRDFNLTIDDQYFYAETPDIQQLQRSNAGKLILVVPYNSVITPDLNLTYGFAIPSNYDALDVKSYHDLNNALFPNVGDGNQPISELGLKLFGVADVLTPASDSYQAVNQPGKFQLVDQTDAYKLYEYRAAVPKYHVVDNAVIASSDSQAMEMLTQPGFDPAHTVVLDAPNVQPLTGTQDSNQTVQMLSDSAMDVRLEVSTQKQPGYLVLARTYYPGWKATVNGVPTPIYRANYAFSAIPLQDGENNVEFYYDPDSVKLGAVISLLSICLSLAAVIILRNRWEVRE